MNEKLHKAMSKIKKLQKENENYKKQFLEMISEFEKIKLNIDATRENYLEICLFMKTQQIKDKKESQILNHGYTNNQTNISMLDSNCIQKFQEKDSVNISLKKLEDLEYSYIEMTKSFSLLTIKYKQLKEENTKYIEMFSKNSKELEELKIKYNKSQEKLNEYSQKNKRLTDINRCVIDISLKNFGQYEQVNNIEEEESHEDIDNTDKYLEPMPSFFMFLAS